MVFFFIKSAFLKKSQIIGPFIARQINARKHFKRLNMRFTVIGHHNLGITTSGGLVESDISSGTMLHGFLAIAQFVTEPMTAVPDKHKKTVINLFFMPTIVIFTALQTLERPS